MDGSKITNLASRTKIRFQAKSAVPWLIIVCGLICCSSSKKEDKNVQAFLSGSAGHLNEKATAELNAGRYSSALVYLHEAISLTPYDPVLFNNMGVAFFHQNQLDSAIDAYLNAVRLRPQYHTAYRNLAAVYYANKEPNRALQAVEQAIRLRSNDAESYSLLGAICEELKQIERAIDAYLKAIALDPSSAAFNNNLGALYFRQGQMEQAIDHYTIALQKMPDSPETCFNLANALARQCRITESMDYYKRALRLSPAMAAAENNLGLMYMASGENDKAVQCFRQVTSRQPDADVALYNLSVALLRADSTDQALPCIEKAVVIRPQSANYHQQHGAVLSRLQRYDEAMAAFHRAVALDSSLAIGFNDLGNAYYSTNDPGQAMHAFGKALELFPEYLDARYFRNQGQVDEQIIDLLTGCTNAWEIAADYAMLHVNFGKACLAMKKYAEAEKAFKQAASLQPDLPDPYESLALLYHQQNKVAAGREMIAAGRVRRAQFALQQDSVAVAERYAQQALQINSRDADAHAALAAVYIRQSAWRQAETLLKKGLALAPNSFLLHLNYGYFFDRQAMHQRAIEYFQQALHLKPNSAIACRALADAYQANGQVEEARKYQAELHYFLGQELEFAGQWDRSILEYRTAAGLTPNNSRYLASQGLVLAKKHLDDAAERVLQNALQKDSLQTLALYGLGVVNGDRGEYAKAIPFLQKAVRLDPQFGQAHYSLAINFHFNQNPDSAISHLLRAQALGTHIRKELADLLLADKKQLQQ